MAGIILTRAASRSVSGSSSAPSCSGGMGTSFGASKNLALDDAQESWLLGLLTADLSVTLTAYPAGARGKIFGAQDGVGGHTLTIHADTMSATVAIPKAPNGAPFVVDIYSLDGTADNIDVQLLTNNDASTNVKGAVLLSEAPASPTSPIAVGDNDPRLSLIPKFKVQSADITINSQLVMQNITDLFFDIGSSATEVWLAKIYLLVTAANAAMDLKVGLAAGPVGAVAYFGVAASAANEWVTGGPSSTAVSPLGFNASKALGTLAGVSAYPLTALIKGGGTAGAVQLQFAQNTSDAGSLTLMANSVMEYYKVRS